MCRQKIYYNTYADGAEDVTEKTTACRDGKLCPHPEVRKYNRKFPFTKLREPGLDALKPNPYFPGDLPTPRRSKSPSPAHRREPDIYTPGAGLTDLPKPTKDHSRHDRHGRSHRHTSRHDREPSSPRLNRSATSPHIVVIDQPPRSFNRDVPPGPVHIAEEYGTSSRRREHDRPRHSPNPQTYVVDDDRERRRHHRERGRRMSTSAYPDLAATPAIAHVYTAEPRRPGLRRSATLVQPTVRPLAPEPPKPPKAKHLRWQDEVNARRARQNADIANRPMAPEVHQDPTPPKGILKDTSGSKGKGREEPEVRELRRAVEGMARPREPDWKIPTVDDLNLYDRDRLKARFGGDEGSGRDRRRSKVWVAGDLYQYF